jgi:hypothetical protein
MGSGGSHYDSKLTTEQRIKKLPYIPQKKIRDYAIQNCGSGVVGGCERFILRLYAFAKTHLQKGAGIDIKLEGPYNTPAIQIFPFYKFNFDKFKNDMENFFGVKFCPLKNFRGESYLQSVKRLAWRPHFSRLRFIKNYAVSTTDDSNKFMKIVDEKIHELSYNEFKEDIDRTYGGLFGKTIGRFIGPFEFVP